jgi:hypothetical protein
MIWVSLLALACGNSAKGTLDASRGIPDGTPVAIVDGAPIVPPSDVDVVITADNAYSFGYGSIGGIETFFQGTRGEGRGIFNCGPGPDRYTVPAAAAPSTAYLYIATWDDLAVTQGVLGQFKRNNATPLYTGDVAFEVCATGVIDFQNSDMGPNQAQINEQIAICNAGSADRATTSAGWVNPQGAITANAVGTLAVGEANDNDAGVFPLACPTGTGTATDGQIDTASNWMWYQPGGVATPFNSTGENTFRSYLIFRLGAKDIPVE